MKLHGRCGEIRTLCAFGFISFDMFLIWFPEGGFFAETAGGNFTPHVVTVNTGEVKSDAHMIIDCFWEVHILLST